MEKNIKNNVENNVEKKDVLTKALVGDVRVYAMRATELVREAARRHKSSHLATAAIGRAMIGALFLSATMKNGERVGLRFQGDGPIGQVVVDAEGTSVRGYAGNPDVYLPPKNNHMDVGGAIGNGTLTVTRYTKNAKPFTGYAPLVDGEIASDLTNYLYTSEQTPSSVALGVLVNKEGEVVAAGGWFIQALPGCSDDVLAVLDQNVRTTPYASDLIDMGYEPAQIIEMLGKGLPVEILENEPVSFNCHCSRELVESTLATLSSTALEELSEDEITEVGCPFCNELYHFTKKEILELSHESEEREIAKRKASEEKIAKLEELRKKRVAELKAQQKEAEEKDTAKN